MPQSGDTLENPTTGERLTFLATSADTDGQLLKIRHYAPQPTVMGVAHFHPELTETFTVEEGRLCFTVDGQQHILNAGDSITVQPRQVHEFENISDGALVMIQEVRPPGCHQAMFTLLYAFAAQGRIGPNGAPKDLFAAALMWEKMDGYVAGPPPFLQRVLMGNLARLARLMGRA